MLESNRAGRIAALLGGFLVVAFVCMECVWAQAATAPEYGGPYMSNPGAIPPEELKRNEQLRDEYCSHEPRHCAHGFKQSSEPNRYDGPYVPPQPGHLTECHPDPNNPEKPICVYK